eukprot:GILJ01004379.1.p1 GENE.GILJ01004379.1~~GILJ01004379.1.p1  ORF type:complete len:514 (-),score=83.95 GILJ01004379.1:259-1800(-)
MVGSVSARTGRRIAQIVGVSAAASLAYDLKDCHNSLEAQVKVRGLIRFARTIGTGLVIIPDYWLHSRFGVDSSSEDYKKSRSELHLRSAKRLLALCQTNGGIFNKAGQQAASYYSIPKEYTETLSVLQDKAPFQPFEYMEVVLKESLGERWKDMFAFFDPEPIGAASLAQVHQAVTQDGREVAVKMQYPGLRQQVERDLMAMTWLNKLFKNSTGIDLSWMLQEFKECLSKELDFLHEGQNAERVADMFKSIPEVAIPKIHWDLSTSQLLTMQFMHGCKVTDVTKLDDMQLDKKRIGVLLSEIVADMIFIHGFVHSDLHPGNLLVRPMPGAPQGTPQVVLLDHGLYRELDPALRVQYCTLWKSLLKRDDKLLHDVADQWGVGGYARYLPLIFTQRNLGSTAALGQRMTPEERKELNRHLSQLTGETVHYFFEHLPRDVLFILRTTLMLRPVHILLQVDSRVQFLVYADYAFKGLYVHSHVGYGYYFELLSFKLRLWLLEKGGFLLKLLKFFGAI